MLETVAGCDDDQDHARGERDRAGARADPRSGAAEEELRERCRAGERDDADARHNTFGVSNSCADSCGPSEKKRPPIDQDERTARLASRNGRRAPAARSGARREPKARALGHRLRHADAPAKAIANRPSSTTYGNTRGADPSCTSDRRDEDAEPEADRARDGVREPDTGRIAARMQVEERGARRAQRGAGREALEAAGDEQPGGGVGEHEEHGRRHQDAQRGEQDRPAADLVGDASGEQQGCEHAEGVGRVDQRQRQRREVPERAVGAVERRGCDRREQAEADHGGGERVGQLARAACAGVDGVRIDSTYGFSFERCVKQLTGGA